MRFSSLPAARHRPAALFAGMWACALCVWVPLYLRNMYLDLVHAKFDLLAGFVGLGAIGLAACFALRPRAFALQPGRLSASILCAPLLCGCYLAAWAMSDNRWTALWGLNGRRAGLALFALCTAAYLIVRLFCPGEAWPVLTALLTAAGALAAALGWLNFWMLDPLGSYYCALPGTGDLYLSTLGNLNFFAGFLCLCFPSALRCVFTARSRAGRGLAGAAGAVILSGLIIANTDTAWVALGAMLALLCCDRRLTAAQLGLVSRMGAGVCAAALATGLALTGGATSRVVLRTGSALLTRPPVALAGLAVTLAVAAVCAARTFAPWRLFRPLGAAAVVLGLIGVALPSLFGVSLGPLNGVFWLRSGWGSNRWDVWSILWKQYWELPPAQKLFGVGADGVNSLLNPAYTQMLAALNGETFDSAHNEYLQHLLCGGALGAAFWIAFLAAHIRRAARVRPFAALTLAGYAALACFSLTTPMLLPLCFAAAAFAAMPPAAPQRDALACFAPGLLFIFPALILAGQVQGIIL